MKILVMKKYVAKEHVRKFSEGNQKQHFFFHEYVGMWSCVEVCMKTQTP